eukprot:scaffold1770_cov375-Prasinococcus_capsulatus_cf.AAC.7
MDYSLLGLLYARLSMPHKRTRTILFSRYLTICQGDGCSAPAASASVSSSPSPEHARVEGTISSSEPLATGRGKHPWPFLCCRIANLRKHQIIDVRVRMLLSMRKVPKAIDELMDEGATSAYIDDDDEGLHQFVDLPLQQDRVFLGLPAVVEHRIDPSSPLYRLTSIELQERDIEIVVLLEGVDASTSGCLEARHAYDATGVVFGKRFQRMIHRDQRTGRRTVDFSQFDAVEPCPTGSAERPRPQAPTGSMDASNTGSSEERPAGESQRAHEEGGGPPLVRTNELVRGQAQEGVPSNRPVEQAPAENNNGNDVDNSWKSDVELLCLQVLQHEQQAALDSARGILQHLRNVAWNKARIET